MKGCSGRCLIGVIIAIIFGSLFLWALVHGFRLQFTLGAVMAEVVPWYLLSLVFMAIAKGAKMWGMKCDCQAKGSGMSKGTATVARATPAKKTRRGRR